LALLRQKVTLREYERDCVYPKTHLSRKTPKQHQYAPAKSLGCPKESGLEHICFQKSHKFSNIHGPHEVEDMHNIPHSVECRIPMIRILINAPAHDSKTIGQKTTKNCPESRTQSLNETFQKLYKKLHIELLMINICLTSLSPPVLFRTFFFILRKNLYTRISFVVAAITALESASKSGVPNPVAASHPAVAVNPLPEPKSLRPCLTSLKTVGFL